MLDQSASGSSVLKLNKRFSDEVSSLLNKSKLLIMATNTCDRTGFKALKIRGPKNEQIYEIFKIPQYGLLYL